MAAPPVDPSHDPRRDPRGAEVLRLLDRYVVEVVERWGLCPWARGAREAGEIAADVLWGAPTALAWRAAGAALLARPGVVVAMVVAPELAVTPAGLRALRDAVAAGLPDAGVAEFHPDAALDLASPARLVPFTRRAPDPLLQLVPLATLRAVRGAPPVVDRARQAALIAGAGAAPRGDVADRIAATNHAVVTAEAAAIEAVLADIARDRAASYARVGIATASRSP